MAKPHQYRISPKNPGAHLFEVAVTVAEPDSSGQLFAMPAWVPGSYMIRDFVQHVVSVRAEADGALLGLTQVDKSHWVADACDVPITLTAEVYAYDLSVRGAYLDTDRGFFDGAAVFPVVVGQDDHECRLQIAPPPNNIGHDWRVATAMRSTNDEQYQFGNFIAGDYAELIDHPVEMGDFLVGEFEAGGIPHTVAVYGHTQFDMARVCHDLSTLCTHHLSFLGKPKDLDRYLFLVCAREHGYGGLEHRWSTSLHCRLGDLPRRGDTNTSKDYRKFLGLCSHEYFHLWNVKRMKPAKFTPYDLRTEAHTGLLWVFEGITSYYDDLALLRSGLISTDDYLELMGKAITRVIRTRGRLNQTLEESSFNAWTGLYKANANSSNAIISYYTKGALVALALDLTLRRESGDACSLDNVMHECWSLYGESGEGMPEQGLESVARAVSGLELADFFERYIRGTTDVPLAGLLKDVGVELHLRPANGRKDLGGKAGTKHSPPAPWLGATLVEKSGISTFRLVHSGSPAEKAGIAPGDQAVAIDTRKLTAANLDDQLRDHHVGDAVTVTVFRDHVLSRHRVTLEAPPDDTCYLTVSGDVDTSTEARRESWLRGT